LRGRLPTLGISLMLIFSMLISMDIGGIKGVQNGDTTLGRAYKFL
jgi:hypothetical protein